MPGNAPDASRVHRILHRISTGRPLSRPDLKVQLPSPPQGARLGSLGFDYRTLNALRRAGFDRQPECLGDLTIEEALALRGFGRRCLEVYLQSSLQWPSDMSNSSDIVHGTRKLRLMLTAAQHGNVGAIESNRFPELPPGICLEDLKLSARASNALSRLKVDGTRRRISDLTIGEFYRIPGVGRLTLVNVLKSIKTAWAHVRSSNSELRMFSIQEVPTSRQSSRRADIEELLEDVNKILGDCVLRDDDPRFGSYLKALRVGTSQDLVSAFRNQAVVADRRRNALSQLVAELKASLRVSLEEEALAVRNIAPGSRSVGIVRAYYGFGDRERATLSEVGNEYGLTRERIRQIASPSRLRNAGSRVYMPRLHEVVTMIRNRIPARSEDIEADLVARGVVEPRTEIGEIVRYAQSVGVDPQVAEIDLSGDRIAVNSEYRGIVASARNCTRRLCARDGATTLDRVADKLRRTKPAISTSILRKILQTDGSLREVCEDALWIAMKSFGSCPFVRRVKRILDVATEVTIGELRTALRREYRIGTFVPPSRVLAEVVPCIVGVVANDKHVRWQGVKQNTISREQSDEAAIVRILLDSGGVCERRVLQDKSDKLGISSSNFWRIVNYSPLISRPAQGVYAHVGARPSPSQLKEAQDKRVSAIGGTRDRGWTVDGKLWIAYVLSPAMLETGIATIPSAMRGALGSEYRIRLAGTATEALLRIGDSSAWGFRTALAGAGAEVGDIVALIFDLTRRTVDIEIGDETLTDRLVGINDR